MLKRLLLFASLRGSKERHTPLSPFAIWTTPDRSRYFLLPDSTPLPTGSFTIRTPLGKRQNVNPESLPPFELSEHQAKVWVASEIAGLLEAVPRESSSTADKILAAAHLVRKLPELLRLSPNRQTLSEAREPGSAFDRQLAAAGINSHSAFGQLPDRIDAIERDSFIQEKRQEVSPNFDASASRSKFLPVANSWR